MLRGPVLVFWVFHVAARLRRAHCARATARISASLPGLLAIADELESEQSARSTWSSATTTCLPANFIDDGRRIWLIDWDYAGFNSPLFDLGGLASNNGLSPDQEEWLLETYFDAASPTTCARRRYEAMKCASLLRETMWSMVSEIHSDLDFDYAAYTAENLGRLEAALADVSKM